MGKKKGRFIDYGGNRKRVLNTKGQPWGYCHECGSTRVVALAAWFRKSKPTCVRCGAFLQPSERAQKTYRALKKSKDTKDNGICPRCGAKLRSGNKDAMCGPCMLAFRKEYPDNAAYSTRKFNKLVGEFAAQGRDTK